MMFASSQTFSPLMVRYSLVHLPTPRMMQDSILPPMGFWGGRFEWTFFDVWVFNLHALSNRNSRLASSYRKHELQKKRQYEQCVREIEHAPFTPLVLSATGGMASEATVFYKRLATCLPVYSFVYYTSLIASACTCTLISSYIVLLAIKKIFCS